jgi:hypothetical protein
MPPELIPRCQISVPAREDAQKEADILRSWFGIGKAVTCRQAAEAKSLLP